MVLVGVHFRENIYSISENGFLVLLAFKQLRQSMILDIFCGKIL